MWALVIQLLQCCDDTMTCFCLFICKWHSSRLWNAAEESRNQRNFPLRICQTEQFPTSSNAFEFAALQCMAWWWVENLFRIYSRVVFQVEIVMTKVLCSLFFSLNLTYGLMNLQSNNLPALFHVASCRLSSSCLFPYLHHHRVLFSRSTRLFLIVTRLNVNAYIFIAF